MKLLQLHDRKAMMPKMKEDLTQEDRQKTLRYLMFIKEKRYGTVKARWCADGRPQWQYTQKEGACSPTVSLEAMMISCCIETKGIDMHGDRYPGHIPPCRHEVSSTHGIGSNASWTHPKDWTNNIQKIHMAWQKKESYAICSIKKALYGTLQAALLFWSLLSKTLENCGFTINPYDQSVTNKIRNGKQCTIVWHMDDLKISHVDKDVIEGIIIKLNKKLGKESL